MGATTPVTTVFLGAVELTLSPTGRITRTYYFVHGQRIALREQRSDGMVVYFLHNDALGSASLVTGLTGTVLSSLRYTPYGLPRGEAGRLPTPYRYTGQREMGVDFYDYQARLYDPAVGRFAQADTLVPEAGQPQSLNRYSYGYNNPVKYTDPSGHCVILATAAIGAAIGFTINLGYQTVPILAKGASMGEAFQSVDWASAAGAAVAGGVLGLTMGIGTALGASTLAATMATGAAGGALGGQAGIFAEAAVADLQRHDQWNSDRVLFAAIDKGFGNPNTMIIDAATGALSAGAGKIATNLLEYVQVLPTPPTGLAKPGWDVAFDIRGHGYLISDATLEFPQSVGTVITVGGWKLAQGVLEEITGIEIKKDLYHLAE